MTNNVKYTLAAAAMLSALLAASAGSAGVIIKTIDVGSGPSVVAPLSVSTNTDTYDFEFDVTNPATQIEFIADQSGPYPVMQFQLYSGAPGSGEFLGQSTYTPGATLNFGAGAGSYYAEVTPAGIGVGGGIPSAVPEPSAWALMLVGFGGLGVAMRSRRKLVSVAA